MFHKVKLKFSNKMLGRDQARDFSSINNFRSKKTILDIVEKIN